MSKEFFKKIIDRDFSNLTIDELRAIIASNSVFELNKKNTKALEKIVESNTLATNKDKVSSILQEGLPATIIILSNLDKYEINVGSIDIGLRRALLNSLNLMNNLQLCIFIDKVLKFGKEEKIKFFKHRDLSLHEINGVISKALGLTLVFEVFKVGKPKNFKAIDYNKIDKVLMIETLNKQFTRHLYVLGVIAEAVLGTEEVNLLKTKINKVIKEGIADYLTIVHKENKAVRETGIEPKKTWTYTLCNAFTITVEDDDVFEEDESDEW